MANTARFRSFDSTVTLAGSAPSGVHEFRARGGALVKTAGCARRDGSRSRTTARLGYRRCSDAQPLSNRAIGQALFVTMRTVEVHLNYAYAELGVPSRALRAALGYDATPPLPPLRV